MPPRLLALGILSAVRREALAVLLVRAPVLSALNW